MRSMLGVLVLAVACPRPTSSVDPAGAQGHAASATSTETSHDAETTATEVPHGGAETTTTEATASPPTSEASETVPSSTEATAAATEPAHDPGPPPTWEWALQIAPALAGHSQESPSPKAYERFSRWFAEGPRTIYVRLGEDCFKARGSVDDGFSFRETVTTEGNTRTRTAYGLEISEHGITETGPGGTTYERDAKGRWKEVGGFGTGCFDVVVHSSMSKTEGGVVYFDSYGYTLSAHCSHQVSEEQACEDGSTRTCSRCAGVWLQPRASNRGWGRPGSVGVRKEPPPVVDCSKPCPADEITPTLAKLDQVLKGRRFYGDDGPGEGVLFLRSKDCRRAAKRERARWRDSEG